MGNTAAGATGAVLDPVATAAMWLATGGADKRLNVVVQLRERFALDAKGACEAIRESALIKARAT